MILRRFSEYIKLQNEDSNLGPKGSFFFNKIGFCQKNVERTWSRCDLLNVRVFCRVGCQTMIFRHVHHVICFLISNHALGNSSEMVLLFRSEPSEKLRNFFSQTSWFSLFRLYFLSVFAFHNFSFFFIIRPLSFGSLIFRFSIFLTPWASIFLRLKFSTMTFSYVSDNLDKSSISSKKKTPIYI